MSALTAAEYLAVELQLFRRVSVVVERAGVFLAFPGHAVVT